MKKLIFVCVTWTVLASVLPASAGVTGRSVRTQTTSTASWGVSVVNQNNVIINQDYPLTLIASGNTSYNYFSLRNTGSLSTSFFTISLLQDVIKNKNLKPGDVIFERCDGLWNTTRNTCSVTPVQVATGGSSSFQITTPLNVGAEIKMRARTPNNNQSISFSLQVLVPRSSVRGGQVTHS
jgi:hypothetical protein